MTNRMYAVYLKSNRVVTLIGTDSKIDKGYLTIYRDVKLIARFMADRLWVRAYESGRNEIRR